MLTPSAAELLAGVADALQATVLPELPSGPARMQVQATIGITRRLAGALPRHGPSLEADIADLAATLDRWAVDLPELTGRPQPAIAAALARNDQSTPARSLVELGDLDRQLQELVATVADRVGRSGEPAAVDVELRALLGRMLAREIELGLSPWEA